MTNGHSIPSQLTTAPDGAVAEVRRGRHFRSATPVFGALVAGPEPVDGPDTLSADEWHARSEGVGRTVLPVMERLLDRVPTLSAAMLCTADGFNMCSLGLPEGRVSQLAALTSSLYSVSNATANAVSVTRDEALDMVNLASGRSQMIILALTHPQLGRLLLWVCAQDIKLGHLVVGARATAQDLAAVLAED